MKKGFILLAVIVILILMATELFVLSDISNKITFQTNGAILEAVEQNLVSSGLAWAEYNIKNGNIRTKREMQLDTAAIGKGDMQLTVAIKKITRRQAEVAVNASCVVGGRSLKSNREYIVPLKQ